MKIKVNNDDVCMCGSRRRFSHCCGQESPFPRGVECDMEDGFADYLADPTTLYAARILLKADHSQSVINCCSEADPPHRWLVFASHRDVMVYCHRLQKGNDGGRDMAG